MQKKTHDSAYSVLVAIFFTVVVIAGVSFMVNLFYTLANKP